MKYLFTAHYKDGSTYLQNADDRSERQPDKRSCFFDAIQNAEPIIERRPIAQDPRDPELEAGDEDVVVGYKNPLVRFEITGEGHTYAVDLTDGHFEVDGVPFKMIEGVLPYYELIFFRQHTHGFNVGATGEHVPVSHDIVYRLGWQCTDDDKNYQRVMQID